MSGDWDQVGGRIRKSSAGLPIRTRNSAVDLSLRTSNSGTGPLLSTSSRKSASGLSLSSGNSATGPSLSRCTSKSANTSLLFSTRKSATCLSFEEVSGRRKCSSSNQIGSGYRYRAKSFYPESSSDSDTDSDIPEEIDIGTGSVKRTDFRYHATNGKHVADTVADKTLNPQSKHEGYKGQYLIRSSKVEDEFANALRKDNYHIENKRYDYKNKEGEKFDDDADKLTDKRQPKLKYESLDQYLESEDTISDIEQEANCEDNYYRDNKRRQKYNHKDKKGEKLDRFTNKRQSNFKYESLEQYLESEDTLSDIEHESGDDQINESTCGEHEQENDGEDSQNENGNDYDNSNDEESGDYSEDEHFEFDPNMSVETDKTNNAGYKDKLDSFADDDITAKGDRTANTNKSYVLEHLYGGSKKKDSSIGNVQPPGEQNTYRNSQKYDDGQNIDRSDRTYTNSAYVDTPRTGNQHKESGTAKKKVTRSKSEMVLNLREKTVHSIREEKILPFEDLLDHAVFYRSACELSSKTEPKETCSEETTEKEFMIEVSKLEIRTCISALLFEDYIVLIFPGKVVKQTRETKEELSQIMIKQAYRLCYTSSGSSVVGVLQMPAGRITLLKTKEALEELYIIDLQDLKYTVSSFCYLDAYKGTAAFNLPDPMHVFCVTGGNATMGTSDKLTVISAAGCRQGGSRTPIYPVKIRHHLSVGPVRGITDLSALSFNTVVISCTGGIKCIRYNGKTSQSSVLWAYSSSRCISDVCCYKEGKQKKVLASFQNDKRIMLLDSEKGAVLDENVLPKGSNLKPDKISVWNNQILVKQFNEPTWCSYVSEP